MNCEVRSWSCEPSRVDSQIEPLRLVMLLWKMSRMQVYFTQQPTGYGSTCCGLDLRTIHHVTSPKFWALAYPERRSLDAA